MVQSEPIVETQTKIEPGNEPDVESETSGSSDFFNIDWITDLFSFVSSKFVSVQKYSLGHTKKKSNTFPQITLKLCFIMAYNKVQSLANYWSSNKSLGNKAINCVILRHLRCTKYNYLV